MARGDITVNASGNDSEGWAWPASCKTITSDFGQRSAPTEGASTNHDGIDIGCDCGSPVYCPTGGKVTVAGPYGDYGNYIEIAHGGTLKTFYGHLSAIGVKVGDSVGRGEQIGKVGTTGTSTACHLHFGVHDPDPTDPMPYLDGSKVPDGNGGVDVTGEPGTMANVESLAKAAALSTYINFPAIQVSQESMALTGERSLMNDEPILPFIQQLCASSLREFQSMPNGNFFAFFPDYFGGLNHRTPYWEIRDIEILSGHIDISDDQLATHVYVVGDTNIWDTQVTMEDRIRSSGNVTVMTAFMADFMNGIYSPELEKKKAKNKDEKIAQKEYEKKIKEVPTLAQGEQAIAFLKKYGARPNYEEVPYIRAPFFEMFYAYQKFCLLWAKQFITTFEFTFMPELFPGGIVAFPDHGIQCFIDEVVHEGSYESGFITRANLSAPTALRNKDGEPANGNKRVHEGMIRAAIFDADRATK